MSQNIGTLYGVGVGPGDPELLTLKAAGILSRVPVVFAPTPRAGATSYAATIARGHMDPARQRIVELSFAMRDDATSQAARWRENAKRILDHLQSGDDAAFITEGDPMLYSTFGHIEREVRALAPDAPIVVVPGISSVQAAAAAARVPLADAAERVAILPAMYEGQGLRDALRSFDTTVLMKMAGSFDRTLETIEQLGLADNAVCVSRCCTESEEIVRDVRSLRGRSLDYFSLMIVRAHP